MYKYGIISEVEPGRVKVHFKDDNIVTDWLPVVVRKSMSDKENWQMDINEHVVCMMDDWCDEGVVMGAITSTADVPDPEENAGKFRMVFSDGTVIEYDKNSSKLTANVQGDIIANATGKITANAGGDLLARSATKASVEAPVISVKASISAEIEAAVITLNGNVTVTGILSVASVTAGGGGTINASGDMIVTGSITANGDIHSGTRNLTTHTHTAPPGGGETSMPL